MKTTNFQGYLDRFEGEFAVVLIGEDGEERMEVPRKLLPEEVKEGDYLRFSVKSSPGKTIDAKKKVEEMLKKLKKGKG